ncbi:MAG TPA: hypothetical protein VMA86_05990, partial [Acetobacteraceae bacterium]|nr:hypothetical protein [Acetobacteraceae bacterium]
MTSDTNNAENFKDLAESYFRGRIDRRRFFELAGALGFSATILGKLVRPARAADSDLLPSDPISPYEAPITKQRVAWLKTKPYKGTTINVMVLKATVGDGLKYHVPHWEEATGGKVNVAEVPIET